MPRLRAPSFTYANVVASLALFIALGGTSFAAVKLSKDSVTSREVKDRTLQAADLAPGVAVSGPAGARGPRGAEGPAGPQGVTGPQGPAGQVGRTAWQPLPLAAGWSQHGAGWQDGSFRRDADGIVRLKGLVTKVGATQTRDQAIATLPAGFRPNASLLVLAAGGQPDGATTLWIESSGVVRWIAGPTAAGYISFDGVTFPTD